MSADSSFALCAAARRFGADASALPAPRPDLTGDPRVDAAPAALAEHVAARTGGLRRPSAALPFDDDGSSAPSPEQRLSARWP